jgi:hypothetical protein
MGACKHFFDEVDTNLPGRTRCKIVQLGFGMVSGSSNRRSVVDDVWFWPSDSKGMISISFFPDTYLYWITFHGEIPRVSC